MIWDLAASALGTELTFVRSSSALRAKPGYR